MVTVGAIVSTVNLVVTIACALPEPTVALTMCMPSVKSVDGVSVQLPLASAVTVTAVPPSMVTDTVALGMVVPVMGTRRLFVLEPSAGAVMVKEGAIALTLNIVVARPVFPAGSLEVAVTEWPPMERSMEGVNVQLPLASVVTTTGVPLSMVTDTIVLGSDVPVMVGRRLFVELPLAGVVIVTLGAVVSTRTVERAVAVFPAGSEVVATIA